MGIISTLANTHSGDDGTLDEPRKIYMVFDTFIREKHLAVGVGIGRLDGLTADDVRLSEVGQQAVLALTNYADKCFSTVVIQFAGVQSVASAKERVSKVLAQAPHQTAVFFVCRDDKVYDAVVKHLHVDFTSADPATH